MFGSEAPNSLSSDLTFQRSVFEDVYCLSSFPVPNRPSVNPEN